MFCLLPYTLQGCRCTPPVCGKPSRSKEKALAGTTDRESSAGAFCLDLDAGVRRESSEESEVLTEVFAPPTLEVLISDAHSPHHTEAMGERGEARPRPRLRLETPCLLELGSI